MSGVPCNKRKRTMRVILVLLMTLVILSGIVPLGPKDGVYVGCPFMRTTGGLLDIRVNGDAVYLLGFPGDGDSVECMVLERSSVFFSRFDAPHSLSEKRSELLFFWWGLMCYGEGGEFVGFGRRAMKEK